MRLLTILPAELGRLVSFSPYPLKEQESGCTFVVDHEMTLDPPEATVAGLAVREMVGAGGGFTLMVADAFTLLPSIPTHVKAYPLVLVRLVSVSDPTKDLDPPHPPLAVHELVLADDHDNVLDPSYATEVGLAVREMVGAGCGFTFTVTEAGAEVPPELEHVIV